MIPELDLHNIKYSDVPRMVDIFLWENNKKFPVIIITGNSDRMKSIVVQIIKEYGYEYTIGNFLQTNTGYIEVTYNDNTILL